MRHNTMFQRLNNEWKSALYCRMVELYLKRIIAKGGTRERALTKALGLFQTSAIC